MAADPFVVHDEYQEDFPARVEKESEEQNMADSLSESGSYDESDEDVDDSVVEDMKKLEDSFRGISKRFRLINRIGEGTFSTVYKAEDLLHDKYNNDWDPGKEEEENWQNPPAKRRRAGDYQSSQGELAEENRKRGPQYVALKKIYVTSSPMRIQNELELLHDLRGHRSVCPLITAYRFQDQVIAVLPYFRHIDFRLYYHNFTAAAMRPYFRSLFSALHAVHKQHILHRDIKPTNFLYNPDTRHGVLVDFGLAEREGSDWTPCLCLDHPSNRRKRITDSYAATQPPATGYPKNDQRPSRRANRAGTRGFRAPEVLLKCTSQTTKIDTWSTGVILLTLLARRFPFFNSADDVDAMIELSSVFGSRRMKQCAALHGSVFETNIPTIGEKGFSLDKIVVWASCREKESVTGAERQALGFLERLLELDPSRRLSAKEALQHEFFMEPVEDEVEVEGEGVKGKGEGEVEAEGDEETDEAVDEMQML